MSISLTPGLVMRSPANPWLRYGLVVNLVVLAALVGFILVQAFPSTEAVRLRNALLIQRGMEADFTWTPDRPPAGFMMERRAPLPALVAAVHAAGADSATRDRNKALALAAFLTRNTRKDVEHPIQSDLVTTYRQIVNDGWGYCADFTEVYLGLAYAAGLASREWGFSFDGFGGHGHAVVEVFDRQRGRWSFVDVFNNFHALDAVTGEPLSALEFRQRAPGLGGVVRIVRSGDGRVSYVHEEKLWEYYRNGASQWFLTWGNAVFSCEADPMVHWAGRVSRSLEQLAAMASGRSSSAVWPRNCARRWPSTC